MMINAESQLTSAQLEIMGLFWEHGELGVAQVWKLLSKRRRLARNTVQTMLSRLADRGWIRARVDGNAFYYKAARGRRSSLQRMLGHVVDTAFAGSTSGLVMTLLEGRQISRDEAERIRALIDQAEKGK